MTTQWERIPGTAYIVNILLINTSILGLGLISIALASFSYLAFRKQGVEPSDSYATYHYHSSQRTLLIAVMLHLACYAIHIISKLQIDYSADIIMTQLANQFSHQLCCTGIALFLIVRVIKSVFFPPKHVIAVNS